MQPWPAVSLLTKTYLSTVTLLSRRWAAAGQLVTETQRSVLHALVVTEPAAAAGRRGTARLQVRSPRRSPRRSPPPPLAGRRTAARSHGEICAMCMEHGVGEGITGYRSTQVTGPSEEKRSLPEQETDSFPEAKENNCY